MDRLPPLPESDWTDAQRRAAEAVIQGPRGALVSPFVPMLRSPELMTHAQKMGEYLRYRSAIGPALTEFAILVTAREWDQQVEWAIHVPLAIAQGIDPAVVTAIAEGAHPEGLDPEQDVVYRFCTELQRERSVSTATWASAIASFGERGVVDLIGVAGYYTFLSMLMNAAGTPAPIGDVPPLSARR